MTHHVLADSSHAWKRGNKTSPSFRCSAAQKTLGFLYLQTLSFWLCRIMALIALVGLSLFASLPLKEARSSIRVDGVSGAIRPFLTLLDATPTPKLLKCYPLRDVPPSDLLPPMDVSPPHTCNPPPHLWWIATAAAKYLGLSGPNR